MTKTIKYQLHNGISYHEDTPKEVIDVLDSLRQNRIRCRLWYGKDGISWDEENETIGYIGRSTGKISIPLLVYNKRSFGGGHLLDHCIIKIVDTQTKRVLYQHPKFKQGYFDCVGMTVLINGKDYANCKSENQAFRLSAFMNGERNSK